MFNSEAKTIHVLGRDFECVYGIYNHKAFCAIINYGICCELPRTDDTQMNTNAILKALENNPKSGYLPEGEMDVFEIAAELSEQITKDIQTL